MNKKRLLFLGIGLGIAVIAGVNVLLAFRSTPFHANLPAVETFQVKAQGISDTLVASGVISPGAEERIYPDKTMGEIKTFLVQGSG